MTDTNNDAPTVIESIAEFMEWLDSVDGDSLLFRGLASVEYSLQSSAERRVLLPNSVLAYTKRLLYRAKLKKFHYLNGEKLWDLELLAELQHNGAATCLIDFTENPLVALWFACQPTQEETRNEPNGLLIAFPIDDDLFKIVGTEQIEWEINKFFESTGLWRWTPWSQNNRILTQHSVFVFGKERIYEDDYQNIEIAGEKKQEVLEELRKKFGIDEEYLFSDLSGFAIANAYDKTYRPDDPEGYFDMARRYYKEENFDIALEYCNESLKMNKHPLAYNLRGMTQLQLGFREEAIADFTESIKLSPNASAYENRGDVKCQLEPPNYEGAIADYTESINLRTQGTTKNNNGLAEIVKMRFQLSKVYLRRGLARRKSDDEKGAQKDFEKAYELAPSLRPKENKTAQPAPSNSTTPPPNS